MDKRGFYAPDEQVAMLRSMKRTPFAKTEDGYRFAYWVFEMNNNDEAWDVLRHTANGEAAVKLFDDAKAILMSILITEDDYLAWTVHKKEGGGVKAYHKAVQDLEMGLLMLTIDVNAETIQEAGHMKADMLYAGMSKNVNREMRQILNRNNPFADVTIKSQQYFYKAGDGTTETLFFNTNNIVEKTDRNGKDMFSMRPGFIVTKEHGVAQKSMQKVTFANSVTEPIVNDEDHIYIHID